ncbi:MAG: hypothetical protein V1815_03185 [Candidatus Woesearchaeota archaeon]
MSFHREPYRITLSYVVFWIVAIILFVGAYENFKGQYYLTAICLTIGGLIAFPPFDKVLRNKFNIHLTKRARIFIVVAIWLLSYLFSFSQSLTQIIH